MYSLYVLAIKRGCFFLHELRQPTVTYRRKFRSLNKTLRQVNAASQHSLYRGPRERARTLCAHHGRASAPPMTHTTSSKFPRHPPPTHPSPRPRLHPRRPAPPPSKLAPEALAAPTCARCRRRRMAPAKKPAKEPATETETKTTPSKRFRSDSSPPCEGVKKDGASPGSRASGTSPGSRVGDEEVVPVPECASAGAHVVGMHNYRC